MPKNYWLVKQEPESYAWDAFVKDGGTAWTGIRNFQARNHLRSMKEGDLVFYYHSGDAREIVGVAKVTKAAYPDPTAEEGDWSAVDLAPVKRVASTDTFVGYAPSLEDAILPQQETFRKAYEEIMTF